MTRSGQPFANRPKPEYRLFSPPGVDKLPAILVLGGGDGGIGYPTSGASRLAPHGYLTMTPAYFGRGKLPRKLVEVELEYFDDALSLLRSAPRYDAASGIGIFAVSTGTEAALLLAGTHRDITAVIAAGPSDVIWESPHHSSKKARNRSSWTSDGKPLAFVAFRKLPGARSIEQHEHSLSSAAGHEDCRIPVERMNASLLLLTGEDDGIWPSTYMAGRIVDRLKHADYPHAVDHVVAPAAGHNVYPLFRATDRILMRALIRLFGGTYAINREAQMRNWPLILAFFGRHLAKRSA